VNAAYNELRDQVDSKVALQAKRDRAAEIQSDLEKPAVLRQVGRPDATGKPVANESELRMEALSGWIRSSNGYDASQSEQEAAQALGLSLGRSQFDLSLLPSRSVNGAPIWSSNGGQSRTRETRAQSVGTNSGGGFTVPEGFVAELERRMLDFNGPRQVARVIRTGSGNILPWPTANDTGNSGADIAENGGIAAQDVVFGEVQLSAYKRTSGAILVSQELLEDTGINLVAELIDIMGERLGRRTAAKYTTGTGSGQEQGIVTGATEGVTTVSPSAIAADEIKNLVHSLDPAYRRSPSTGFMAHDNVWLAVRKLKDSQNRYLWQDSIQLGMPDRLEGFPVTINQSMAAAVSTGNVSMLFGDFSKFVIRDVNAIRFYRLDELYRANDQTGFMAFLRTDSRVLQPEAIKTLQQS
jgi:HK97 family phage major capsid protein